MVLGVKIILKTSLAVPGALAHRLQCRTVCNDALPETPLRLLNPKWPTRSGNMSNPRFLDQSRGGVWAILLVPVKIDPRPGPLNR